ncbi:aminoglycoside phosphotransferase family protein [Aliarcobacter cryaerophilus]|jgi:aminoglycoside phosphotransferase (APT) family kinase protein|uniref:aminoglycoside phosphotransferase family protein n=1 Tax=Aliarcobacter cryaerophilus TaxID=28198 RepID=UPI003DA4286D
MKKGIENIIQKKYTSFYINTIKELGSGNDSIAYLINDEYVFKFPKHKKASLNLQNELKILNFIDNSLSLSTPKVEYWDIDSSNYKEYYIGYKKISGSTITVEMFNSLSENKKEQIANNLAKFLNELHSLNYINNDIKVDKAEKYRNDYKFIESHLFEFLTTEEQENVANYYKTIFEKNFLYNYRDTLVHNDFSLSNMVFDINDEIVGIIDFGDVAITDRDNDFLCLLEDSDEEFGREFGIEILIYYGLNEEEIKVAIEKAIINDEYWVFEQFILSYEYDNISWRKESIKEIKELFN